jgi:general L-amino acid transport system substrate-binding protein
VDPGRPAVRTTDSLKAKLIDPSEAAARKGGGFHLDCCLLASATTLAPGSEGAGGVSMNKFIAVAAGLAGLLWSGTAMAGKDLDAIKARGMLNCGVGIGTAGFMLADSQGKWKGLSVDVCRAVSAALFGDAEKVRYVPLTSQQRFTAVQSGEVDMVMGNATYTLTRDTALGLDFTGIFYYDGQSFLVPKKLGVKSARELNGATICVAPGTTTELNLADYFRANKMTFKPVVIEKVDEIRAAFFAGRCDVYTTDASALAATRAANVPPPRTFDDFLILPEIISKEPLGPVVRHGDNQFADIVRWALYAMIEAEEYGINSKNVDEMLKSDNPAIKRILGVTPGMGKALGVDEKWVYTIVKQVGNYGESFDRNLGPDSPLKIDRGLNKLWTQGGLQYAPPIR